MSVELCMIGKNTPNNYIHIDVSVHYDVGVPANALDGPSLRSALDFLWKYLRVDLRSIASTQGICHHNTIKQRLIRTIDSAILGTKP